MAGAKLRRHPAHTRQSARFMAAERSSLDVTWRTIGRILIVAALVWAWLQLWKLVMVIVIAIIMAVALDPAVRWLEQRRISRGVGAFVVVLLLTAVGAAMIAASWVTIQDQSRMIAQRVSDFANQIRASVPLLEKVMPVGSGGGADGLGQYALGVARSAWSAFGMIVLALVLTVYLLIEWKQTLEWLIAFVPERHRPKTRRTLEEAREIVYRYAVGNVIASIITGVITYVVLAWLKVPAALVLALVSGMLNFIPIIGFFVSSVLATVLAATVSTNVLMLVITFYLVFNVLESYFITPKVFGRELEMSDLAVLIAVIVGAQLGGVMGALLSLPIAAIYPTIERIWLRTQLSGDTVERHNRLSA
jgi:predicted PurR-regulated permease PerM